MSRSPVREAIRLLTAEQLLVERDGNPCAFQPSLKDFRELSDLRLAIEPVACQKAVVGIDVPALQMLRDNIVDTETSVKTGDYDRLVTLNKDFHQCIWRASGNHRFFNIMQNVSAVIQYYSFLVLDVNQQQTDIVKEHGDIVSAIVNGDESGAFQLMHHHISKDLQVIASHVREFDNLSYGTNSHTHA